jgi:hypothetical protein
MPWQTMNLRKNNVDVECSKTTSSNVHRNGRHGLEGSRKYKEAVKSSATAVVQPPPPHSRETDFSKLKQLLLLFLLSLSLSQSPIASKEVKTLTMKSRTWPFSNNKFWPHASKRKITIQHRNSRFSSSTTPVRISVPE